MSKNKKINKTPSIRRTTGKYDQFLNGHRYKELIDDGYLESDIEKVYNRIISNQGELTTK